MLPLDEALAVYAEVLHPLPEQMLSLEAAHGQVLARDITALLPLPPMTQSAMDGYALRSAELDGASPSAPRSLPVSLAIAAGTSPGALPPGTCARIMTGAPLPAGADAVEIQENVERDGDIVQFRHAVASGANVRQEGEEVAQGQVVLPTALRLGAQHLGIAASAGHAALACRRPLRAAVIVSGDELLPPGSARQPGQIFESNGHFLRHFLHEHGVSCGPALRCPDDPARLQAALAQALENADLVLLSGGASVGDHDYSRGAAQACGVVERFWKVAQKPGKPISFGLGPRGQALLILPGNPASVHACIQVHGRAAIAALRGQPAPATVSGRLSAPLRADQRRERLVRAVVAADADGLHYLPLPFQASHMLSNLARAQALLRVPAGCDLATGAIAQAWLLGPPEPAV